MKVPPQVRRPVVFYVAAAAAWILLSTPAAGLLADRFAVSTVTLELVKGAGFVAVTAALLTVVLTRSYRSMVAGEQQFHALAEAVREGLYVQHLRPHRRFVFVNPALEVATGVPAHEWYADPNLSRRHVDADVAARLDAALEDPAAAEWPLTLRWHRPDGTVRWLEISETPMRDERGEVMAVQGVAVDVTDRHERETALAEALDRQQAAAEELRRLQDMQRAFLQAVSHDLRTPLTVILGLAEVLDRRSETLDEQRQAHLRARLRDNAQRLSGLLTDLLDIDRLTRGVIEPQRRWVDVSVLVRQTVAHLDTGSHHLVLPNTPAKGNVDPAQVARIVENLVANAVKHTPAGTEVRVCCDRVDQGVLLVVEDSGPGLSDEQHRRIFEPFVRAGAGEASPGSGIGLTLVREFARLHHGDAWVEPGEPGCRFLVELPDA